MPEYNVVLMARIDDMAGLSTVQTRSTIVPVDAPSTSTPPEIAEMALEIGPPVNEWAAY